LSFAGAGLLGVTAMVMAQETKPAETKEAAAPAPSFKMTSADFAEKVTRDSAPIANAGQLTLRYADVVQRILPSVVSISTYSKKPGAGRGMPEMNEDDLEQLPPMFREFFKDWMERRGGQPNETPSTPPRGRQQRPQQPRQTGLGSGMILTADGYILTNNHVVESADEIKVVIAGRGKEYTAKVIGTDPQTDVALIKIEGTDLPHATFGDSSKLRVGDVVLAVGSPMGLVQSVTQGIVSALGRSELGIIGRRGQAGYENFIQTDAAINPGNSGGPLVDGLGRVIGINTAIETQSGMFAGIGLAIPIDMALNIAVDLLDDGKVDRGFLGIQMDPVDPSMADFLGLKDDEGVTVTRVVPDSPADKAGFEEGDVVVGANGEKVEEPSKLRLMVSAKRPGESVKFNVVRFNEQAKKPEKLELNATLEKLDTDKLAASGLKSGQGKESAKPAGFLEGVRVENLNDELRKEYNVDAEVSGVLVTSVEENSPAAKVGLQEGDVILQVNRQPVKDVAEARSHKGDAGNAVQLKVLRAGQTKFLVIKG
ncbi:MAG: Do family serine endopeptidase, partial [Verrucomicrobium sp.]